VCDNPSCVNPEHLFLGTAADNAEDMVKKGRSYHAIGEKSPSATMKDDDARAIRDLYADGEFDFREISKLTGIA